ncbi:MAG: methionyl-tRNA formyltransferase [Actinobacteria bacterium]|nr:methionyl-tRNA formyltransferase [Actinomycetota bacterium]
MRLGFFGTPDVAVPSLTALAADDRFELGVVVTNPDRPRGRSKREVAPPVKEAAIDHGLEVWQPHKPREIQDALAALRLDACAVVAYGSILPRSVLDAGGRGFVNLHFSLLPRWRGAAPVQHALRQGDDVTGLTTFVLDEGMDTGPILRQERTDIGSDETAGELLDRLAVEGAALLADSLHDWLSGALTPTPQPDEGATIAPRIRPDDCVIDWTGDAASIDRLVRASNPAPGAHTSFDGRRLKVWRSRPVAGPTGDPGEVVDRDDDGPIVATAGGALVLIEVQPEGKSRMSGSAFENGYQPTSFGA